MTTNKPGIEIYEPSETGVTAMRKASFRNTGPERYVRLSDYEALQAECEKLRKEAALWEPIHDEIHRRAGKEHALADNCDFTVTVMCEDYASINAAMKDKT